MGDRRCCQSDPPPCSCSYISTPDCILAPSIYRITVPAFTNSDCSSCDTWVGNWKLCWDAVNSRWDGVPSDTTDCGHNAGDPLWRVIKVGSNYELQALGLGLKWSRSAASWSCQFDNEMSLSYPLPVPTPCINLPGSITLRSCTTCPRCLDTPDNVTVTISGIQNTGVCTFSPGCTGLNASYVAPLWSASSCIWRKTGFFGCSGAITTPYTIYAFIGSTGSELYWNASLTYWGRHPIYGYVEEGFDYRWYSGSLDPFDCTAERTLSYYTSRYGTPPTCQNFDALTVTIN